MKDIRCEFDIKRVREEEKECLDGWMNDWMSK